MKKIIKIIKREFLTKVFTKGFLIGTVLGPIFIIGVMLGPAYFMTLSTENQMVFRVIDYSNLFADKLQEVFSDTLKNGQPRFIYYMTDPAHYEQNKEKINADIEKDLIDGVVIISEDVLDGGEIVYMAKSVADIDLIQKIRTNFSTVVSNERLKTAGLDPQEVKKLTRKVPIRTVKIVKGEERARGFEQEYFTSLIFLMILYVTILFYGQAIARGVTEEKTSRIIEILLSSTNSFHLMLGKLLGIGAVGLTQYIIWAIMSVAAFLVATTSLPAMAEFINISPAVLFYFVVFFIIGFFTFSTLFVAVGAMSSDMQDIQSLSTPVTFLIIIPFILSFMIIKDPTSQIAQILSFIPFFTPLIMFLRISLVMPAAWEIIVSLVINIVTILGIMWLCARIFRVGILMYGKRPTVPEIVKWLRYS
ncbi:MAG: ABC transporter permease [Calditrichia bacterium]